MCPASLVYNWLAEFERFAPELDVRAVAGTKRERVQSRREAFEGGGCDVLVTSYDLLRIDAAAWAEHELFCCVLDEAQYLSLIHILPKSTPSGEVAAAMTAIKMARMGGIRA